MKNHSLTNRIYLKPGDIVDIVAPSSKCHPSVLEKLKELLESWGLQSRYPEDIFGDSLLYANSDEKRFSHLNYALTNEESKLVWCLLGGYGATKLIPMLNKLKPPPHSKQLIGFSDATALHIFLQGQWGWSTIHGPSGYQAALNKVSADSIAMLKKILFNEGEIDSYEQITPLNSNAMKNSEICAPIIGGNLHMIQASLGTIWQIDTDEKILFIEEINERAYRIDRVLAHLSQAGLFEKVKAILFGDLIDKGEPDGKFLVMKTIEEFASQCNSPVLQISNIGHGPINNPIILGLTAKLSMGSSYSLEFV
ncbi:MAG: LD-carboxypeptidase [Tatlockia sp.]|nr:LD-carboxypeptidase [Tatlockia sp.]